MNADPRYEDVNARSYRALTQGEARVFAAKLLRKFGSPSDAAMRAFDPGDGDTIAVAPKRTDLMRTFHRWYGSSGTRRCWASTRPTTGHDRGFGRLIHDVSHVVHRFRHPKERPHGHLHSAIEREIADYVQAQLWHLPSEPKVASLEERRAERLVRLIDRRKAWTTKAKRAATALRKINAAIKRIEKLS